MKKVRTILVMGCILGLAAAAHAGQWRISAQFGSGQDVCRTWGGYAAQYSSYDGLRLPRSHPPYPPGSPWGDGCIRHHPWPPDWWRHRHYPGPWYGPTIYYSTTPVVVTEPYVATVITGTTAYYEPIYERREVSSRGGVFVVPMNAPPREAVERVDMVEVPNSPATGTLPALPRPSTLDADLGRIAKLFKRGNVTGVEEKLRELMLKHPSDARLSTVYAYVLFLREKYTTSAFVLRRALTLDGEAAGSGLSMLEGFYDAEETARALDRLNVHVTANPSDPAGRLVRAYVRLLEGNGEAAREDLSVILKANSTDPQAAQLLKGCTPQGE